MWGKFFQLHSKFKDRTAATRQLRIMCPVSLEGAMTYKRQPNCKTRKWPRGPVLHGVGCCEAQQRASVWPSSAADGKGDLSASWSDESCSVTDACPECPSLVLSMSSPCFYLVLTREVYGVSRRAVGLGSPGSAVSAVGTDAFVV